jgi:hypothetical protein
MHCTMTRVMNWNFRHRKKSGDTKIAGSPVSIAIESSHAALSQLMCHGRVVTGSAG